MYGYRYYKSFAKASRNLMTLLIVSSTQNASEEFLKLESFRKS